MSAQVGGGRTETYEMEEGNSGRFVFNSTQIGNNPKTIRSQRILHFLAGRIRYELNMAMHQATEFQNHLSASLERTAVR